MDSPQLDAPPDPEVGASRCSRHAAHRRQSRPAAETCVRSATGWAAHPRATQETSSAGRRSPRAGLSRDDRVPGGGGRRFQAPGAAVPHHSSAAALELPRRRRKASTDAVTCRGAAADRGGHRFDPTHHAGSRPRRAALRRRPPRQRGRRAHRTGVDLEQRLVRCTGKGGKGAWSVGRHAVEALRRYPAQPGRTLDKRHRPELFLNAGRRAYRAGAFSSCGVPPGARASSRNASTRICGTHSQRTCSRRRRPSAAFRRCQARRPRTTGFTRRLRPRRRDVYFRSHPHARRRNVSGE